MITAASTSNESNRRRSEFEVLELPARRASSSCAIDTPLRPTADGQLYIDSVPRQHRVPHRWGWKTPKNSYQLHLLLSLYPNLIFIQTVRNPLDMSSDVLGHLANRAFEFSDVHGGFASAARLFKSRCEGKSKRSKKPAAGGCHRPPKSYGGYNTPEAAPRQSSNGKCRIPRCHKSEPVSLHAGRSGLSSTMPCTPSRHCLEREGSSCTTPRITAFGEPQSSSASKALSGPSFPSLLSILFVSRLLRHAVILLPPRNVVRSHTGI